MGYTWNIGQFVSHVLAMHEVPLKFLVTGSNSMVQKEATHNNMVRNVKPYHENDICFLEIHLTSFEQ